MIVIYILGFLLVMVGLFIMTIDAETKGISEEATKLVGLFLAVIGYIFIVSYNISSNIEKEFFKKPIENINSSVIF
jgi:positive regulator of sigma E activity